MINLSDEDKKFIKTELAPYLKNNDRKGLVKELQRIDKKSRKDVLAFLIETGIPILESMDNIPRGFLSGSGITKVTIPGNIKKIGADAFKNCESLVQVIIEDGVETLDNYCFQGCRFSKLDLPDSIESIGGDCFYGSELKEISIPDSITFISKNRMFDGCSDGLKIYANSRKDMPKSRRLRCSSSDVEWLKQHLFVKGGSSNE